MRVRRARRNFTSYTQPFQELVNKRPKKSGAPEEDNSGVEVYYREGEDEVEVPKLPPGVRLTAECRVEGRLWGGAPCLPRAELSQPIVLYKTVVLRPTYLSQATSLD